MAKWFAKYGFPIAAVYLVKPEGGVTIKTSADVKLIKLVKNVRIKGWKEKIL